LERASLVRALILDDVEKGLERIYGRKMEQIRTRLIADIHSFVYGSVAEDYWT
jgi:hypothetical protein